MAISPSGRTEQASGHRRHVGWAAPAYVCIASISSPRGGGVTLKSVGTCNRRNVCLHRAHAGSLRLYEGLTKCS